MIMAKPPARRQGAARLPGLFDWLYSPGGSIRPFGSGQLARIEDYTEQGVYVIREELPGLDPERDVEVTVESGVLAVHAERREEHEEAQRSEFRYGSLTRSVALPSGADSDKITARIHEVKVPVKEPRAPILRILSATAGAWPDSSPAGRCSWRQFDSSHQVMGKGRCHG